MLRFVLLLLFVALIGGCLLTPRLPDDASYQRGLVSIEEGVAVFQPCGRTRWRPMDEVPERLRQEYLRLSGGGEGLPIYLEGWIREVDAALHLIEPRVIGGDLNSCDENFSGAVLYAAGSTPPWSAILEEGRLVFNQPRKLRTLVFDAPQRMRDGEIRRWYQSLDDGRRRVGIALDIKAQPCQDPQGVWYALTAQVDLDGRIFSGCARYGDLQRLTLNSHYRTATGEYLRDLHLLLKADGSVRLIEDNHDGRSLVPRSGQWRFLNAERILLELARPGVDGVVDTQLWRLQGEGALVLLNDDPALGRGLKLQPVGRPLQWPSGRVPLP